MRTPKEFFLSLLSREVRRAYRTRNEAIVLRDVPTVIVTDERVV